MGYSNVVVYNEGLPEWIKRGYPAETMKVYPAVEIPVVTAAELKQMIDSKAKILVLDIRDEDDVRSGMIAGSQHVDLELLDGRLGALPRDRKIVLVDLQGKQTQIAGRFLSWKGFKDVVRLDGGIVGGWIKAGLPVAK